MLFSSCLEVLVSGYSFYVWAWSRSKVMRMGVFVSLVSQNLQGSYLWGWGSVSLSVTAGVHIDLITPPSYFVFIFVPFWGWSLGSWDRWASRLSAVGCKETISVDTWSVSVSSLSPPSDLHLRSEWSMQAWKAWRSMPGVECRLGYKTSERILWRTLILAVFQQITQWTFRACLHSAISL